MFEYFPGGDRSIAACQLALAALYYYSFIRVIEHYSIYQINLTLLMDQQSWPPHHTILSTDQPSENILCPLDQSHSNFDVKILVWWNPAEGKFWPEIIALNQKAFFLNLYFF